MHNEFTVPHEVCESKRFRILSSSSKVLYMTLCRLRNRYGDNNGQFWRRLEDLAEDTGLNIKTVSRAKTELLSKGFIEKHRGHYQKHGWRGADWYEVNGYQVSP